MSILRYGCAVSMRWLVSILVGCGLLAGLATAQDVVLDAALNEQVLQIPNHEGLFTMQLETTLYKPSGAGPFPLVVINHGKAYGDPRFQNRYRPVLAARFFLQRGYAVIVPMRQGFSKSEGNYIGGGCNVESNGRVQAEDVKATLDYVILQPWADKEHIVVLGQSHGGWTTLAFGVQGYPGVKGLINFAGGLRQEQCPGWEGTLARSAAGYAAETKLPSIWFYGDNDSYFNTETFHAMYEQYVAAGGKAQLVAYGKFGSDSHTLFGSQAGGAIWESKVSSFLASIGLPHKPLAEYAKYAATTLSVMPPRTDFATLEDESKLPFVKDAGRAGYKSYLTKSLPRAFAIAPNGAWGWANSGNDPLKRALDTCNKNGKGECKLYSADNFVVWKSE